MKHSITLRRWRLSLAVWFFCIALIPIATTCASLAPENVAVVINGDSWASKAVANEFIALHRIPQGNVVYLTNIAHYESVKVDAFRNGILKPALTILSERGIAPQIDCLVYAPDLPMAIDIRDDFPDGKSPGSVGTYASATGLTYLCELLFLGKTNYTRLDTNYYFRRPDLPDELPNLTDAQQTKLAEAIRAMKAEEWAKGAELFGKLAEEVPAVAVIHFRCAECLAEAGEANAAVAALAKSIENGFYNAREVERSSHLASLRGREDFKELEARVEAVVLKPVPVTAFRHAYAWMPTGERAADGNGPRYLLSTMLGVTSGRGTSVDEAIAALRRSAAADGTSPEGTFYFARNDDIRSTGRDWLFGSAVVALRAMGKKAEIVEGTIPRNKPDVMGASVGAASFDWGDSGNVILPGAICENFTSYGGILVEKATETPLSEFIRYGAAGSCGTVDEPFAVAQKFPSPFLHAYYASGCSLAEAFYQSVAAPYQLLVVGDPLCTPWAARPELSLDGLAPDAEIAGQFEMTPRITGLDGRAVAYYELYIDGVRRAVFSADQTPSADSAQLADGRHELTLIAVLDDAVETRSRITVPVRVNNHGGVLSVSALKRTTYAWDEPLIIEASAPGAQGILFLHNQRIVGTITGESGKAEVDLKVLGQGPIRLHTLAVIDREKRDTVFGPPVDVEIVPPPPMPAMKTPEPETLAPGLVLDIDGVAEPVTVTETWRGDCLLKAGAEGKLFSLNGIFEVSADGVYQFQIKGDFPTELSVDGTPIGEPSAGYWRFFPVSLATGTHKVSVSGIAPDVHPELEIRFGGEGTHSLSEEVFMHKIEATR